MKSKQNPDEKRAAVEATSRAVIGELDELSDAERREKEAGRKRPVSNKDESARARAAAARLKDFLKDQSWLRTVYALTHPDYDKTGVRTFAIFVSYQEGCKTPSGVPSAWEDYDVILQEERYATCMPYRWSRSK